MQEPKEERAKRFMPFVLESIAAIGALLGYRVSVPHLVEWFENEVDATMQMGRASLLFSALVNEMVRSLAEVAPDFQWESSDAAEAFFAASLVRVRQDMHDNEEWMAERDEDAAALYAKNEEAAREQRPPVGSPASGDAAVLEPHPVEAMGFELGKRAAAAMMRGEALTVSKEELEAILADAGVPITFGTAGEVVPTEPAPTAAAGVNGVEGQQQNWEPNPKS